MIRRMRDFIQEHMRNLKKYIARKIWDKKNTIYDLKLDKDNFITNNGIKSILIMRDDGKIGDMVVNTFVFREIKKKYPDTKIGVVARGAAIDIIKDNKYIDSIYEYKKKYKYLRKLGNEIKKEKYDLLIDFSLDLREHQIMFINKCDAKINIGINKTNWKLFDITLDDAPGHVTNRYKRVIKFLGVDSNDISYDIQLNEKLEKNTIRKYIKDKTYVVINPYAASKYRNLSFDNIIKITNLILEHTNYFIYIIGEEKHKQDIEKILKKFNSNRIEYARLNSIQEVATIIKYSQLVITPDTSIVHIAVGFDKKLICIYRRDNGDSNSITWGPNSKNSLQIFSEDITPLGIESDINKFEIEEIKKGLIKWKK